MPPIQCIASLISGLVLATYWGTVMVKGIRLSRKIGKDPNFVPRERTGQLMRLLWAPTVMAWCLQPWLLALVAPTRNWWALSPLSIPAAPLLAVLGALVGIVSLALTFFCWRQMGRSWRIGIDPKEKTQLIITGAYRLVRHPIYALSILLMLSVVLTCPTPLMLLTALIHISMLQVEARREEAYLITKHGDDYRRYKQAVGRFMPRSLGSQGA